MGRRRAGAAESESPLLFMKLIILRFSVEIQDFMAQLENGRMRQDRRMGAEPPYRGWSQPEPPSAASPWRKDLCVLSAVLRARWDAWSRTRNVDSGCFLWVDVDPGHRRLYNVREPSGSCEALSLRGKWPLVNLFS